MPKRRKVPKVKHIPTWRRFNRRSYRFQIATPKKLRSLQLAAEGTRPYRVVPYDVTFGRKGKRPRRLYAVFKLSMVRAPPKRRR